MMKIEVDGDFLTPLFFFLFFSPIVNFHWQEVFRMHNVVYDVVDDGYSTPTKNATVPLCIVRRMRYWWKSGRSC